MRYSVFCAVLLIRLNGDTVWAQSSETTAAVLKRPMQCESKNKAFPYRNIPWATHGKVMEFHGENMDTM